MNFGYQIQRAKVAEERKAAIKEVLEECLTLCEQQGSVCYAVDLQEIAERHGATLREYKPYKAPKRWPAIV